MTTDPSIRESASATHTPTEMAAMAHARRHALEQEQMLRLELDTYCVLDGRAELKGCVRLPQEGAGRRVSLTVKARETGAIAWQRTLPTGPDSRDAAVSLPVGSMPGGYYTVEALDDGGRRRFHAGRSASPPRLHR